MRLARQPAAGAVPAVAMPGTLATLATLGFGALLVALGASCWWSEAPAPIASDGVALGASEPAAVSPERARRVLDRRCVVCHGCYDAPCQLVLSSQEGLERGASKEPVYHADRLMPVEPSRLFLDEPDTAGWRRRGFTPVLAEAGTAGSDSLLLRMLALGRANPFPPDERLPDDVPLDIKRKLTCPTAEGFGAYAREHPTGGMPYAMAPLPDDELADLVAWVEAGAPAPEPAADLPVALAVQVARWERFLNRPDPRSRLVSRYLYEHWFLGHMAFPDHATGPFFQVVRSRTGPGRPVDAIATRRPYDDPGARRFWYRLRPIESTIVHKTHIVYRLDDARMARLEELFYAPAWDPGELPGYDPEQASNPFDAFAAIPVRARYQFMLDDAGYFVMSFIRGPVCRGQVAVDVIEDRFFVVFLDPDHDPSVLYPAFLDEARPLLQLPAEQGSGAIVGEVAVLPQVRQTRYLDLRARYVDRADPARVGPTLDFVWDGEGHDRDAMLTVFRHFDNATVVHGFVGTWPETAWVIDYPIFERIYYDLVAGFDVFGNVAHQVATRLYMDHLRMQSENLFLSFLPADRRDAIRASWYVNATHEPSVAVVNRLRNEDHGTRVVFRSSDVVADLLAQIAERSPRVSGPPDTLGRCADPPCIRREASPLERAAESALQRLAGRRGPWVAHLPEVSLVRVRAREGTRGDGDALYTLLRDRAHTNVAAMFLEELRLQPEADEVTVVRGPLGSYPNFLFEVPASRIDAFVRELVAVEDEAAFEAWIERFGVRRTSPRFWANVDWVQQDLRRRSPTESGVLDLNRYVNR